MQEKPAIQHYSPIHALYEQCEHQWESLHKAAFITDTEQRTWEINSYFCYKCYTSKSTKSRFR
jgi:hypothetical protein